MKKLMMVSFSVIFKLYNFFLPTNKKKIMFILSHDIDLTGNMGAIYNEVIDQNLECKVVFLSRDEYEVRLGSGSIIQFIRCVIKVYFVKNYHLATSRIVILDDFFITSAYLTFKKDVKVIQLWHASCAFKKFGLDSNESKATKNLMKKSSRCITHIVVNSTSAIPHYASAFNVQSDIVLSIGSPRTDFFFDQNNRKQEAVYSEYPELEGKRIILYAPTIRGSKLANSKNELLKSIYYLENALGDEYVLAIRTHPRMAKDVVNNTNSSKFVVDVSRFKNINQLLFASDVLITDYSSIIAEYALLKKMMLFYPYDIEEYLKSGNGFYQNYEQFVPGPIVHNMLDVVKHIKSKTIDIDKINRFLSDCYDYHDGKSSERVVNNLIR